MLMYNMSNCGTCPDNYGYGYVYGYGKGYGTYTDGFLPNCCGPYASGGCGPYTNGTCPYYGGGVCGNYGCGYYGNMPNNWAPYFYTPRTCRTRPGPDYYSPFSYNPIC